MRNHALGIDNSPVSGTFAQKRIVKKAELSRDVLDEGIIRGIIAALAEDGGLEMRNLGAGCRNIQLTVIYNDAVEVQGFEKTKRLLVTDKDITEAALRIYQKTANRRIRVRSIHLSLENFSPLSFELDLFDFDDNKKERRLQKALDSIQGRFGVGAVTRGIVFSSSFVIE